MSAIGFRAGCREQAGLAMKTLGAWLKHFTPKSTGGAARNAGCLLLFPFITLLVWSIQAIFLLIVALPILAYAILMAVMGGGFRRGAAPAVYTNVPPVTQPFKPQNLPTLERQATPSPGPMAGPTEPEMMGMMATPTEPEMSLGETHVTPEPQTSAEVAKVSLGCFNCHAILTMPSSNTSYSCPSCGAGFVLRRCSRCLRTVVIPELLVGGQVKCLSCGNTKPWSTWDQSSVPAAEIGKLVAPASAPPIASSVADELTKLAKLRDDGILSETEFACAKARLLGRQ